MRDFPLNTLPEIDPSRYPPCEIGWCDGGQIGQNGLAKVGICAFAMGNRDEGMPNHVRFDVSGATAIQTGDMLDGKYEYPGADMMTSQLTKVYHNKITNNQSEWMAMLYLLMHMPDGWSGTVVCDSITTINRWFNELWETGIHPLWRKVGFEQRKRLGKITPYHVHGHLSCGGWASAGNVLCDNIIRGEAAVYATMNDINVRDFIRPNKEKQ